MKLSNILLMSFGVFILIGTSSCKKEGCTDSTANNYNSEAKEDDGSCSYTDEIDPYLIEKQAVKETYANIAFAVYEDSYNDALTLQATIDLFVGTPTQINFDAAKQAWLNARESYGQTEIFRFVDGPIDNPADGPEGLVNAWPMDEVFVDYVVGSPNAGIINNLASYPTINVSTLVGANEFGGEENVSVGYHAIEFLLWGQDLSSSTAGVRPYTDYVISGSGTASNQGRRATYLSICADLLVQALDQVKSEWDPIGANNYRITWLNMDNKTALRKMFNSIRVMSGEELSGERIYTAYDNQDQEDEHSCFSDNTHRDIALNSQGIENLYLGTYTRTNSTFVSGFSLRDLVALVNSGKNTEMIAQLTDAKTKISLMMIPFDQAIVLPAERPKVLDVVNSLVAEESIIVAIATSFDITF
jgi:putative iron-regulated protein